ncbi:MAG: zinc ribbon domain-containing protein [Deltaproteobacteria bacterium]|nr:zinc ribbon domain-containing protein [Deltaproteobacteria bacterium]
MPIYEFKCKKCSTIFEILFRSSNESLTVSCPACKSKKAERLLSKFGGKIGTTSSAGCSSCAATTCGP